MINNTNNRIKELNEYIEKYQKSLLQATTLHTALLTHTSKMVDVRFFEKHFTIPSDTPRYKNQVWTLYGMRKTENSWEKPYSLYGVNNEKIELDSRDTEHVIHATLEKAEKLKTWIAKYEKEVQELEQFNEQALVEDLLALYSKHNVSETMWRTILEDYQVKYPNN